MTQAKGAKARVLLGFESVFNTDPADIATKAIKLAINSCTLTGNQNTTAPATITGQRDPVEPIRGNIDSNGDIVVPVDYTTFGYLLKACFGAPTTTGETAPYVHEYKPGDTQPSLVIEKGFQDIAQYMKYNGCKVSKLSLSVGGDGELTATLSFMGAKETISITSVSSSPVVPTMDRLGHFNASLKIDGTAVAISTNMSLDIDFGLDGDTFAIGANGGRAAINEGLLTIGGSITTFFENADYLNKAIAGTAVSIELILTSGANVLSFLMPEVKFARKSPSIDGPAGIKQELAYNAFYKSNAKGVAIVVTLTNATETY